MVQNHPSNAIKVALIGDVGVGKSTILSVLQGESFSTFYVQTKGKKMQQNLEIFLLISHNLYSLAFSSFLELFASVFISAIMCEP